MCTSIIYHFNQDFNALRSYLVTDYMATDLDTIFKSRKLGDEFTRYFLYQIMVRQPTLVQFESSTYYFCFNFNYEDTVSPIYRYIYLNIE